MKIEHFATPDLLDEIPEIGGALDLDLPRNEQVRMVMRPGDTLALVHRDGSGRTGVVFVMTPDRAVTRVV